MSERPFTWQQLHHTTVTNPHLLKLVFFICFICSNSGTQPEIEVVTDRILDELVVPLAELSLDDTEFACLKALIFFDSGNIHLMFTSLSDLFMNS